MRKLAFLLLFAASQAFAQFSTSLVLTNQRGTTLPAACAVGQLFFKTDAAAGSNVYGCTAANTWTAQAGGGSGLTIGTTAIASGTTTRVLYDNAGVVGEYTISGTGNVCMTTSCSMTTPSIGAATGTSLVLSGNLTAANMAPLSGALTNGGLIRTDGTNVLSTAALTGLLQGNGTSAPTAITPGTGVVTALGVNIGSAGAPVLFDGAGGTPSSLVLTNATGYPLSSLAAATGTGSINNGDNPQTWNWALTTATRTGFHFTENTAAINGVGSQFIVQISTAANSTAAALNVAVKGNNILSIGVNGDGTMSGGRANSTSNGQHITVRGGTGGTNASGGNVVMNGGAGGGTNANGGHVTVVSGAHVGTGVRGGIYIGTATATQPTLASGGCTSAAMSAVGVNTGTTRFSASVGTSCSGSQPLVFTLPAAANGWNCYSQNSSNAATSVPAQSSAVSTTSVTVTNYARTTGLAAAWTDNDLVVVSCLGG